MTNAIAGTTKNSADERVGDPPDDLPAALLALRRREDLLALVVELVLGLDVVGELVERGSS